MLFIRSLIFNIAFFAWSIFWSLLSLFTLVLPRKNAAFIQRNWSRGISFLLRILASIRIEVRGQEKLDEGAMIVACKHQSAWETTFFQGLFENPAIVMKKELLRIPFFGWYTRKMGMIAVDRSRGMKAMRELMRKASVAAADGRKIVIFPEGTRVGTDDEQTYRAGIFGLYRRIGIPVVPVALNSGLFWSRHSFFRYPGTIVLEFLEPIEPGLDRGAFMERLTSEIEEASERLNAETAVRDGQ